MESLMQDYVVGQWFVSNKFGLCISGRLLWCRKWTVWSWSMASLLDMDSGFDVAVQRKKGVLIQGGLVWCV